ncbi:MAG: transposase [Candidatus Nomurabacteria bacterium]|nr:transposase [Candidatus Nomurabacteria bacterium]
MLRSHTFSIEEFYHLYNRGTEKRAIFLDINDYHRFIILLYLCNSSEPLDMQKVFRNAGEGPSFTEIFKLERSNPLVSICAWTLMPNHFHLLIKEKTEGGITLFMRKVNTGYSMYFNKKYGRTGNLFAGKFKSEHVNNDNYLKYLFSYIHLNPIKLIKGEQNWKESGITDLSNAKEFLSNYEYSSLQSYLKDKNIYNKIISKESFPEYFPNTKNIWSELVEWLTFKSVKEGPSQE